MFYNGFGIAEITCPTKYFKEASSINFREKPEIWFWSLACLISLFSNKDRHL